MKSTCRLTYLPNHSALEHDEHEQSKDAVIPVLIQAPESDTKDLEDEERCGCVFTKELGKRRNGDVELVLAVQRLEWFYLLCREARRCQEGGKWGLTRAWIWEAGEYDW